MLENFQERFEILVQSEIKMPKHLIDKPDTLKQNKVKEWIKIKFLSNHLRYFPKTKKL